MKHPTPPGSYLSFKPNGFTYLILLFGIALLGISLAGAGALWSAQAKHSKMQELDFVGNQFLKAIDSYYKATPGDVKKYPQSLEDLVLDTRYLFVRRHLRRIYADPFSKKTEWGLVRSVDGGIQGIYSLHLGQSKQFVHQGVEGAEGQ